GGYEDALQAVNEDIKCKENNELLNQSHDIELVQLYSARARIGFALSNYKSALSDLDDALGPLSGYLNSLTDTPRPSSDNSDRKALQGRAARNIEQILRLCRALSLMKVQRFDEAMEEVNAAAADPVAPNIRSSIQSARLTGASLQPKPDTAVHP